MVFHRGGKGMTWAALREGTPVVFQPMEDERGLRARVTDDAVGPAARDWSQLAALSSGRKPGGF
jgi:hypothetical protein